MPDLGEHGELQDLPYLFSKKEQFDSVSLKLLLSNEINTGDDRNQWECPDFSPATRYVTKLIMVDGLLFGTLILLFNRKYLHVLILKHEIGKYFVTSVVVHEYVVHKCRFSLQRQWFYERS